jgi:hypothetical protein
MGEFGRAPTIALEPGFAGSIPGCKHWAGAYPVLVAAVRLARASTPDAADVPAEMVQSILRARREMHRPQKMP